MLSNLTLVGWCNIVWAGDPDTRKSTTSYAFTLAKGAISWQSKHQPTVAHLSTETGYMVLTQARKAAIWL